jgi:hypothetical protein
MRRVAAACAVLLIAASCGRGPVVVAPGQAGEFVLEARLGWRRQWNSPTPIQVFCPETSVLTCPALGAFATSSPVKLPFTIAKDAAPGVVTLQVPVKFTFCKKGAGTCVMRDEKLPARIDVRPGGSAGTARVPLTRKVR